VRKLAGDGERERDSKQKLAQGTTATARSKVKVSPNVRSKANRRRGCRCLLGGDSKDEDMGAPHNTGAKAADAVARGWGNNGILQLTR
jgi:hypothetical protein